jgi:hypothetical protein
LRREGLYQSQIREYSQAREAKASSSSIRKALPPSSDADGRAARRELDRLTRENARLAKALRQTEAALEIMGKLHVLLESISESTGGDVPHTVHADRGPSTTSGLVSDLLTNLGVTRSHSRPRVSNDNPYSEAQFHSSRRLSQPIARRLNARDWPRECVADDPGAQRYSASWQRTSK